MILALIAAAMNSTAPGAVETLIARLGPQTDHGSIEEIGRFRCRAVPALVRQLEVVRSYRVDLIHPERSPGEIRVFWTIAALRYISGRDYYAPLTGPIDPQMPGQQMLVRGAPPNTTKFFGIWMSRGNAYFATRPQQHAIIRQWRAYAVSDACRHDRRNSDFMFYLYGGEDRR